MSELVLEARGLRKRFGETLAVADLTLQVAAGEVFGFLGPNGAGKTTSVKMLLGLTRPTAGAATVLARPLGDTQARTKVGFLPEHFRFHEWLRAAEFLDLHGRLYGMPASHRAAAIPDLLELVGLAEQAETRLGAFSKGMLQRIGLAQALLNDPLLVFLDEPTSGLDPMGRRLVRQIIDGLRAEGTAVFLNSHLLSEVEQTCDRVAFIRDGYILQTMALDEMMAQVPVALRVGQPDAALLEGLRGIGEGVRMDGHNGRIHLTLPHESDLPRLAQWIIAQEYTLYELTPRRPTLEERFLQIVNDEW